MKTIFLAHKMEGSAELNRLRITGIAKLVYSEGALPVYPYLDLDLLSGTEGDIWVSLHEYFGRGFLDEVWICSAKSPSLRRMLKLAEAHNVKVVDAYSSSPLANWGEDLAYTLNTQVRSWAHKGVASEIDVKGEADKSGLTSTVDEALNAAVALARHRVQSIGNLAESVDAFNPMDDQ